MMSEVTKYSFAASGAIGRMESGGISPMNSVSGVRKSFAGSGSGAGSGIANGQWSNGSTKSSKQKPAFTRGGSEPVIRMSNQASAAALGGAVAAAAATAGAEASGAATGEAEAGLEDASKPHDADMDSDWLDDEEGDGALDVEEW